MGYVNLGGGFILRKAILLIMALVFCLCSHLRPAYDFRVGGELVKSRCTPAAARAASEAAIMAAEEILPGKAQLPEAQRKLRLTLRQRSGAASELCSALLCNCEGVMAGQAVYSGGQRLGCVKDGAALCATVNRYIENTLPTWAKSGHLSQGFMLYPVFTRAEYEVSNEDMLMLLTGLAPVMYTDGKGRVSPV